MPVLPFARRLLLGKCADKAITIQVGNEFGAVEALWSQFEGVMAHGSEEKNGKDGAANEEEDDETGEEEYGEEVESASEKR